MAVQSLKWVGQTQEPFIGMSKILIIIFSGKRELCNLLKYVPPLSERVCSGRVRVLLGTSCQFREVALHKVNWTVLSKASASCRELAGRSQVLQPCRVESGSKEQDPSPGLKLAVGQGSAPKAKGLGLATRTALPALRLQS